MVWQRNITISFHRIPSQSESFPISPSPLTIYIVSNFGFLRRPVHFPCQDRMSEDMFLADFSPTEDVVDISYTLTHCAKVTDGYVFCTSTYNLCFYNNESKQTLRAFRIDHFSALKVNEEETILHVADRFTLSCPDVFHPNMSIKHEYHCHLLGNTIKDSCQSSYHLVMPFCVVQVW